jgi:hypothetical protein
VIDDIDAARWRRNRCASWRRLRTLAAAGARQSALRRAGGEGGQVHLHRPQLLRPRGGSGHAAPKEPIVFMKAISALNGPDDPIMLPQGSKKTDWEVELGIGSAPARSM